MPRRRSSAKGKPRLGENTVLVSDGFNIGKKGKREGRGAGGEREGRGRGEGRCCSQRRKTLSGERKESLGSTFQAEVGNFKRKIVRS